MADGIGSGRRHAAPAARALRLALVALAPLAAGEVRRYGVFEADFTAGRDPADPLAQEVVVEFRGPEGAVERVPAFWDGGRHWKVRFSPERAGLWKYTVRAPELADPGLHNQSGAFRAVAAGGPHELARRGPPRLAPDRRYFVHADGRPWFWLGDTAWNGALLSTDEEWAEYLKDRAGKGFTVVQIVMTQWRAGRRDELGQTAFSGADRIQVHPAFFQRMDRKVRAVNDHGLVAACVLLWALSSKEGESPGEALPEHQAILLARYMTARYGAYGVLWVLGGDGDYRGPKAERWKAIGRAVFPEGRSRRPVTLHPRGMQNPWPDLKDEPWLDFLMFQSGHGNNARKWEWNATQGCAAGWKLEPPRPVIDGEINYEGHADYRTRQPIREAQVRRAAYYSLLAGPPAGVTYGAHGIWAWARRPETPLDHPNSGLAEPWRQCLDYPGARQMKVLREIFESLAWWRLRPDRTLLAEDPRDPEFQSYPMPARSQTGEFALIYLPGNPSVKLNLSGFRGSVRAVWMDPRTGGRRPAGRFKPAPAVELKTPGEGDWLLLLTLR